jgi:hypothetical protein
MICQQVTLSGEAEWPKVADAVIEADFSARVFVAYAMEDSSLAEIVIKELERAQFRIKRSGVTRVVGGWIDIERLRGELNLCKVCVLLWSDRTAGDHDAMAELSVVRDLDLPVLFLKVGQADPKPQPDTERVLDLNVPSLWDALVVGALSDCLKVDEMRRRERRG